MSIIVNKPTNPSTAMTRKTPYPLQSDSIAAIAGALYLVLALGGAIWAERLAFDTPRGAAIAANFGVGAGQLGLAVVVTFAGFP